MVTTRSTKPDVAGCLMSEIACSSVISMGAATRFSRHVSIIDRQTAATTVACFVIRPDGVGYGNQSSQRRRQAQRSRSRSIPNASTEWQLGEARYQYGSLYGSEDFQQVALQRRSQRKVVERGGGAPLFSSRRPNSAPARNKAAGRRASAGPSRRSGALMTLAQRVGVVRIWRG